MNRQKDGRHQSGFTLIELMIAMLILSFISLGIYNASTETFRRRTVTEQDGDFYNSLRMALDVIARDVSTIYTPQTMALPAGLGSTPTGASGQPPQAPQGFGAVPQDFGPPLPFWGAPINDKGVRPSRFQGEEKTMMFVSNSHMRLYRDTRESELVRITYALEEPKTPDPSSPGKILMKHEDVNVFAEDDRRGETETETKYVLIDIVKAMSFEYLDGEKDAWSKRWDSEGMDHKGKLPDVIKVTIEVFMPGDAGSTFTVVQQYKPELRPL